MRKRNIVNKPSYIFILFFLFTSLLLVNCSSKDTKRPKSGVEKESTELIKANSFPKFEFTKEIHKFGEISEGEIVVCDFYYKNIGSRDLIISNVETSCGCAIVEWDKKPLKSGKEAKLTVEFNSKGRYGKQYKVITIFCNTLEGTKELVITAQIK